MCREDVDHICRLYSLTEQQHRHLILLNKFGASSSNLAVIAGVIAGCTIHSVDPHLTDAEYRAMLLSTFQQVHISDAVPI